MRRPLFASFVLLASTRLAASQPQEPAGDEPPLDAKDPPATPTEPSKEAAKPAEPAPEPAPEPKRDDKPAVTAKYDAGLKLTSADKAYDVKLQFRNQVRFESLRPFEDNSQFQNRFFIARARLQFEGHVFGPDNRYKVELGLGDTGSFSFLKDMYLEKKLADGPVYLRFGQWKRPFFRQEMISDFASEFNERSIANEFAGGGRDLGFALHNDYEKSAEGIEWVIGMFNGFSGGADRPSVPSTCTVNTATGAVTCVNGRPTTFPTDFGPTIVARAGWNSAKAKGYSEADLEGGPLRYSIGAAYKIDLANFSKRGKPSVADNLSHGLELDWNIKANGFSVSGGIVMMKLKDADPEYGVVIQPGLMVVPKKTQVAARLGLVTEGDRNLLEALGAFNYFWHGHRLKLATDFGILKRTGADPMTMATDDPDFRVRIMGQLEI